MANITNFDEQLRARRAFRTVPVPWIDGATVAVRILTEDELAHARIECFKQLKEHARASGGTPEAMVTIDPDHLDHERMVQVIWRAFFDPETLEAGGPEPRPFFPA